MFGRGAFGTKYFGEVDVVVENYVEAVSGGVLVGGSVALTLGNCACNVITVSLDPGGLLVGGSVEVSDTTITGGCLIGGSVRVKLVGDPYDGFAAYYHLGGTYNGTTGEVTDSSRFDLNGTGGGGNSSLCPVPDDGVACSTSSYFGGTDFISLPPDVLTTTQPMTISAWIKIDPLVLWRDRTWFSRGFDDLSGNTWSLQFGHSYINQLTATIQAVVDGEPVQEFVYGATTLTRDQWYYVACVYVPGQSLSVYLNGTLDGNKAITETTLETLSNGSYIGRWNTYQTPQGNIQDLSIRGDAVDSAYLTACYLATCDPSFISYGSEVTL